MLMLAEHSPTPEVYRTVGILGRTAGLVDALQLPEPDLEFETPGDVLDAMTAYLSESLVPYRGNPNPELAGGAGPLDSGGSP